MFQAGKLFMWNGACVAGRHTCESVMRVLRSNKDSVMAMLEAFVHDPLINWRLLNTPEAAPDAAPVVHDHPDMPSDAVLLGAQRHTPQPC